MPILGRYATDVKRQRGFVDGRRLAGAPDWLAAGRLAFAPVADADDFALAGDLVPAAGVFVAFARVRAFAAGERRFAAVVFAPVVAAAPDETRVECFARCFTTFLGAASATEAAAKATSSAARSTLRLRIIGLR